MVGKKKENLRLQMIQAGSVRSHFVTEDFEEMDHDQRFSIGRVFGYLCYCIKWYNLHFAKLILEIVHGLYSFGPE